MLDWVTGASRSQSDGHNDPDEIPETPAHIFAARAFKNLLFGTPAPNDMTVEKPKRLTKLANLAISPRRHSTDTVSEEAKRPVMQPRHSDPMASPSKGILVAPGSISTKRKSVSFGGLGRDLEALRIAKINEQLGQLDKELVPTTLLTKTHEESLQDGLRRSLFNQRSQSASITTSDASAEVARQKDTATENKQSVPEQSVSIPKSQPNRDVEDQTIDLSQPRSTSGQHWKREYQRDHDNSKAEMKKLIQYNQMTKSYAEKRDRDAVAITQKLNEAESKAKAMEKEIQKLAARLMDTKSQSQEQESILSQVASQTVEAMKHKGRAKRYRAALNKHEQIQSSADEDDALSPTLEVVELQNELSRLKVVAERAEARASKTDKENASLQSMLKKLRQDKQDQEQRYEQTREQFSKKETRLATDNHRLTIELRAAKSESSLLREELRASKQAKRAPIAPTRHDTNADLFDLSQSRIIEEATPPASDEELRRKANVVPRSIIQPVAMPDMDFSFPGDVEDSMSYRKSQSGRQVYGEDSTPLSDCVRAQDASFPKQWPVDPAVVATFDTPRQPGIDTIPYKNSSPLMKSFVDNLGSRQAIPPERIAAAKKRLEAKAAERRATPRHSKIQDKLRS